MKINDWITSVAIIIIAGWDYLSGWQVGLLVLAPIAIFMADNFADNYQE